MTKRIKIWQLYIFPFLVILFIFLIEQAQLEYHKMLPFETVAQNTNALAEIDIRQMQKATVVSVIDGDTIEIDTGERVRYIGVDTPETKHPNKPVQCYGREASQRNKELVEGKEVLLEKDISDTDRYGRLLRYIYLPNPEASDEALFVNEYLIEQGYGQVITYPPDVKYHQIFLDAQRSAQQDKKGLWNECR